MAHQNVFPLPEPRVTASAADNIAAPASPGTSARGGAGGNREELLGIAFSIWLEGAVVLMDPFRAPCLQHAHLP